FKLLDAPDLRKEHKIPTPTMGGISFTIIFLVLSLFWKDSMPISQFLTIVFCVLVLFPIGMIDDTKGISAIKKLLIELVLGFLLVSSGLGIHALHGIFGIHDLSIWQQYAFNMILMAGLINAFNLIDGINGLAGGLGLINSLVFAFIFYMQGNVGFTLLAISFAGALFGFLRYNFNKAKIFMGDTGSLHLGLMMTVMGTAAINGSRVLNFHHTDMILLVSAIWLIPVFDTLRVFAVRMIKGKRPFAPDKSHVHHLLVKSGLNHVKASVSLYAANVLLIISVIYSPYVNPTFNFLLIFAEGILLIEILTFNRLLSFYLKSKSAFIKTTQIIYGQLYLNK
ncbi:MAG: undecaprenyl/decaprenyl-phosphate alpha-N-acetylglucosaminyl 1-phosphate transferase, partial [Bacteroidia bacterium]|nr:undecaprenyl/decaprenyl-phosphate alpha-N-acetylglucosaminyl 1-phosphate transferase [Bacteroidia bacterium]